MRKIIGFVLTFLFIIQISSAFAVKAELEVSPRILKLGETGRCSVKIYDVDSPLMPKIKSKDFDFVSAGTGSQIRIINGKYEKFQTFSYYFTPKKIGEFVIGPFDYEYKRGKTVRLNAVKIKVVAPERSNKKANRLKDYLFGKISSDVKSAYKGQTLDLVLSIYFKDLNIGNRFRLVEVNAKGLKLGEFTDLGEKREVVNDEVFTVRQFKVPVTITDDNEASISPVLGVPVITKTRRNNFFNDPFFDEFNTQTNYINIKFDKYTLNVKQIPLKNRPKSFNGAVGKFTFNAQISPTEVKVGEPIKIDYTIKGKGNIAFVVPPEIKLDDKFKVYDLSLINENISKDGSSGTKLYEQVIVPKSADIKEIPQIAFSYFDPYKEKFVEIKYGPFPIKVKGDKNAKALVVKSDKTSKVNSDEDSQKDVVRDEILYLKPAPSKINESGFWKLDTKKIVYGYLPPFFILLIMLWYFKYSGKNKTGEYKKVLKETLKAISDLERKTDVEKSYYEKLNKAVEDYFRKIFDLKEGEIPGDSMYLSEEIGKYFKEFFGLMQRLIYSYEKSKLNESELKTMLNELKENLKKHNSLIKSKKINSNIIAILLIFGFGCVFSANAMNISDVQQKFVSASKYYDSGKFEKSVEIYESLIKNGVRNESVFYNLGNAYFKEGKFGKAIVNYKRALFLSPRDTDIKVNLKFAEEKLKIKGNKNVIFGFIESFKFSTWYYVSVILFWMLVIFLFLYLKTKNKIFSGFLYVNLILFVISLYAVYYQNNLRDDDIALITSKNVMVKYAPVKDAKDYFKIKEGMSVKIIGNKNNWFKILYKNKKGWIKSEEAEKIWK